MKGLLIVVLLSTISLTAQAASYKCPQPDGSVELTHQWCADGQVRTDRGWQPVPSNASEAPDWTPGCTGGAIGTQNHDRETNCQRSAEIAQLRQRLDAHRDRWRGEHCPDGDIPIRIGLSIYDVQHCVGWGMPNAEHQHNLITGTRTQYIWRNRRALGDTTYVYTDNGRVSSWSVDQ